LHIDACRSWIQSLQHGRAGERERRVPERVGQRSDAADRTGIAGMCGGGRIEDTLQFREAAHVVEVCVREHDRVDIAWRTAECFECIEDRRRGARAAGVNHRDGLAHDEEGLRTADGQRVQAWDDLAQPGATALARSKHHDATSAGGYHSERTTRC
jgi:hypothetical protein